MLTKENDALDKECNEAHALNRNLQAIQKEQEKHTAEYRETLKLQGLKINAYRDQVNYWKSQFTVVNEENEELAQQQIQMEMQMQQMATNGHVEDDGDA